jgi:hypothetical protein
MPLAGLTARVPSLPLLGGTTSATCLRESGVCTVDTIHLVKRKAQDRGRGQAIVIVVDYQASAAAVPRCNVARNRKSRLQKTAYEQYVTAML